MSDRDPTRAPIGRLARLGVVLDPTRPDWRRSALLCDRARIDAVWLSMGIVGPGPPDGQLASDGVSGASDPLFAAASELVGSVMYARSGAMLRLAGRDIDDLAAWATRLVLASATGFELGITDVEGAIDYLGHLAGLLATNAAGRPRLSGVASSMAELGALVPLVDDIVLPAWRFPDLEAATDEARAEAVEADRDPSGLGVAVLVPVSIGRTQAEASARADQDALFGRLGHPREIGIFGTLEECQDRVIALAHAGVTDIRALLPDSPDVHDVIAQLTAITIGTTDVLVPGSLRSPAPPPPEGWGGRSDRAPTDRVSGGSRRH